ncbi:DUF2809 domain-containing protein [Sphingomonas sp. VNH70]|uniref:ribosomal maturation YjgA family protein n=1 Tax=Sphingomonas silueang TaxID=3156617 RepID=UPI0032B37682
MRWHSGYAIATAALLVVEIGIALFVRDAIVRPYVGDALAVVLVHCGLRTITRLPATAAALTALLVAIVIEFGQYFNVLQATGLADSEVARTVLGSGFDPHDFIAYALGALAAWAIDGRRAPGRGRARSGRRSPR